MARRPRVIDDSDTMRAGVAFTLWRPRFDATEANYGPPTLGWLDQADGNVVLTALNAPEVAGVTLIEQRRGNLAHKSVPILISTTATQEEERLPAEMAGPTAWRVKPVAADQLLAVTGKVQQ